MTSRTFDSLMQIYCFTAFILLGIFQSSCTKNKEDHPEYFEAVRRRSEELRADGNFERSIRYVDSAYAASPDPGIGDRYIKYYDRYDCYFCEGNNRAMALLYADSMLGCLKGYENDEKYVASYVTALVRKGEVLVQQEKYQESFRYFFKAKNIAEKVDPDFISQHFYTRLGLVYYRMSRYDEAAAYFKLTLTAIPDSVLKTSYVKFSGRQTMINNIGLCYENLGKLDSALYYYQKALYYIDSYKGYEPENSHYLERARGVVLGNMGMPFYRLGDTAKAESVLKESIRINLQPGYENRDAQTALIKLSKIYLEKGKLNEAEPLLAKLKHSLDSLPDKQRNLVWLELNSQYQEDKGDIKQAFYYSKQAAELKLKYEKQDLLSKGFDLNKEFEKIEKEDEIEHLKERHQQNILYLILLSCLTVMAALLVALLARNRRKSKERMALLTNLNDQINVKNTLLERSVKLLDVSQSLSKTGGWEYNLISGEILLTKESYQLYGLENNFPPTLVNLIEMLNEEDKNLLETILLSTIRQELKFKIEAEILTKANTKKWVRIIAEPLIENGQLVGSIGAVQDITQERDSERIQQNLTTHLQTLISSLEDIVFEVDGNKRFKNVWINDESELFMKKENFIGKTMAEAFGGLAGFFEEPVDRVLKDGNTTEMEYTHLDKNIDKWYKAKTVLIKHAENPEQCKLVVSVQDITLRKKHELALKIAKEKLEQSNLEKDRIMQVLVHDLRSPLSGINSVSTMLLQRSRYSETDHEMLSVINDTSLNLFKMVNDLVEVSLNTEHTNFKKEMMDLSLLLNQTVIVLQFKADEKSQKIITDLKDNLLVNIDAQKMQRVLNNLISNALKFSSDNSRIFVAAKREGSVIRLSVEDEGIGIPDHLKDKVFDVFTSAKRLGTNNEQPFGLGLSICKQIVEAHGGKIWFESKTEGGTVFFVEINSVSPEEI